MYLKRLLLNNWHINAQLVEQTLDAATGHPLDRYPRNLAVLQGIIPVLFRQGNRSRHLWNRWEPQRRQDKRIGLGAGHLNGSLYTILLLQVAHIFYSMEMIRQVRQAGLQLSYDRHELVFVQRLRCPAAKDKVIG